MELIVPTLGESITEATVSKWLKKVGDSFEADEPLVEIETDKITVEVPAPSAGSISEIKVHEGADVNIGGVLALLGDKKDQNESSTLKNPVTEKPDEQATNEEQKQKIVSTSNNGKSNKLSPAVKKLINENDLDSNKIISSRSDGRLTKSDVFNFMNNPSTTDKTSKEREEVVKMSKIRKYHLEKRGTGLGSSFQYSFSSIASRSTSYTTRGKSNIRSIWCLFFRSVIRN